MTTKQILAIIGSFAGGVGVGILTTRNYFKTKYENFADAEIGMMEQYYTDGVAPYVSEDDEVNPVDQKDDISKQNEKIDYHRIYNEKNPGSGIDRAEQEHPVDSDEDETDDIGAINDEEMQAWKDRHKKRVPRIISAEEAESQPEWVEMQTLYFYDGDGTITEEDTSVIDEPHHLLGNCLEKYNFAESDEDEIYVLNYAQCVVYDVIRVEGEYEV